MNEYLAIPAFTGAAEIIKARKDARVKLAAAEAWAKALDSFYEQMCRLDIAEVQQKVAQTTLALATLQYDGDRQGYQILLLSVFYGRRCTRGTPKYIREQRHRVEQWVRGHLPEIADEFIVTSSDSGEYDIEFYLYWPEADSRSASAVA